MNKEEKKLTDEYSLYKYTKADKKTKESIKTKDKQNEKEENMENITINPNNLNNAINTDIIIAIVLSALAVISIILYKKSTNKRKKKTNKINTLKPAEREITPEEKAELDRFVEHYENYTKYSIVSTLGNILWLPLDYIQKLEKKYPKLSFPELDNSIVHLDDPWIADYILKIAKRKFGIQAKDELLKYDYKRHHNEIFALENLIKEKALKEILEEIEPYVPEEERELYEKYKKGEEKFIFNF